jgi:hypothetical protein
MDRFGKRLSLALSLSLLAAACSAPTIPNDSTDSEDPNADSDVTAAKAPKKTTPPKKTTTPTAPPEGETPAPTPNPTPNPTPTPTPAPNACAGQQGDACFDCCDQASGGALAQADNAFGQCACGGGACTSACSADFCTGAQPSAACEACLTGTCEPQADALCTSAACKAGQQCAQQCQ